MISCSNQYSTPIWNDIPEAGTIQALPAEMISHILSFLPKEDMPSVAAATRKWTNLVIDTARIQEISSITRFTRFLVQRLGEKITEEQRGVLLTLCQNRPPLGSVSLLSVKASLLQLKEPILDVLKTVADDDLKMLFDSSEVPIPHFFEDIIELIFIYRRIDAAQLIPVDSERRECLESICNELVARGYLAKAISMATTLLDTSQIRSIEQTIKDNLSLEAASLIEAIPKACAIQYSDCRNLICQEIALLLARKGSMELAIEAASHAVYPWRKECLLGEIFERVDIEEAVDIVLRIADTDLKDTILKNFACKLIDGEDVDQAIVISLLISSPSKKAVVFNKATGQLIEKGDLKKSAAFVMQWAEQGIIDNTLWNLSHDLFQSDHVDLAVEIALKITEMSRRDVVLCNISGLLMKKGNVDLAEEIADKISCPIDRSIYLCSIAKDHVKRGEVDQAVEIIHKIPDPAFRGSAFESAIIMLIERGEVGQAIEVAHKNTDQSSNDYAFRFTVKMFMERGDVGQAVEIAHNISWFRRDSVLEDSVEMLLIRTPVEQAVERVNAIADSDARKVIFEAILQHFIKKGDFEGAIDVFSKCSDTNIKDSHFRMIFSELKKTVQCAQDDKISFEILSNTCRALVQSGFSPEALQLLSILPSEDARVEVLIRVSIAFAQWGDGEKSNAVVRMIPITSNMHSALMRTYHHFAEKTDLKNAIEMKNRIPNNANTMILVRRLVIEGKTSMATEVVRDIRDDIPRSLALEWIVDDLIDNNDVDGAIDIMNRIPNTINLYLTVKRLVGEGKISLAKEVVPHIPNDSFRSMALECIPKDLTVGAHTLPSEILLGCK